MSAIGFEDERLALGLYAADTTTDLARELRAVGPMFARLWGATDPAALDRPARFGHPDPEPVDLRWMGRQALHEVEHHLGDVQALLSAAD